MVDVRVHRPASLSEALGLLAGGSLSVMAGGTDWMVRHRSVADALPESPGDVLLVGHLPELRGIGLSEGILRIGAAATFAELLASPLVPPCWKPAFSSIGSPAVRNLATLGGNVCNASPAADSLPLLSVADAGLVLASVRGVRCLGVEAFLTGPGRTALAPDELLVEVRLPLPPLPRTVFRKVGQRKANAVAKVSFCGASRLEGGVVREVRMAFGAVAPTIARSREAEAFLAGIPGADVPASIDAVLSLLSGCIVPIDDVRSTREYRREVALRLARQFLEEEVAG